MRKRIYVIAILPVVTAVFLFLNIAGGDEGDTAGVINNREQNEKEKTEETHSGGWQLQVMPNMGNRLVRDLYFTDSLTGYAVASPDAYLDSAHILKTTNGGFNWIIKATYGGRLKKIKFVNHSTGYAGGNKFLKTTNAGENWLIWNWTVGRIMEDMFVVSEDTVWYGDSEPVYGGVYRTTNGGLNWEKRDSGIPANSYPDKLYFYNSRIGFAYHGGVSFCYKTTNSGESWFQINSADFVNMYFVDSLKGFRSASGFFRTSNGGLNWSKDSVPSITGNTYTLKAISNFIVINEDTIYCTGGAVYFYSNGIYRNIIYKSTNGGINWGYQIPDTSYQILQLNVINNYKNYIWIVDKFSNRLIYSLTGGDTTIYAGTNTLSTEVPDDYKLYQNYPNPFNSSTIIKYDILKSSNVKVEVFDILGERVQTLVNENHLPGTYNVSFNSKGHSSGIYFYRLSVDDNIVQTKKFVLLK